MQDDKTRIANTGESRQAPLEQSEELPTREDVFKNYIKPYLERVASGIATEAEYAAFPEVLKIMDCGFI